MDNSIKLQQSAAVLGGILLHFAIAYRILGLAFCNSIGGDLLGCGDLCRCYENVVWLGSFNRIGSNLTHLQKLGASFELLSKRT